MDHLSTPLNMKELVSRMTRTMRRICEENGNVHAKLLESVTDIFLIAKSAHEAFLEEQVAAQEAASKYFKACNSRPEDLDSGFLHLEALLEEKMYKVLVDTTSHPLGRASLYYLELGHIQQKANACVDKYFVSWMILYENFERVVFTQDKELAERMAVIMDAHLHPYAKRAEKMNCELRLLGQRSFILRDMFQQEPVIRQQGN